jgi:hypothetical protein
MEVLVKQQSIHTTDQAQPKGTARVPMLKTLVRKYGAWRVIAKARHPNGDASFSRHHCKALAGLVRNDGLQAVIDEINAFVVDCLRGPGRPTFTGKNVMIRMARAEWLEALVDNHRASGSPKCVREGLIDAYNYEYPHIGADGKQYAANDRPAPDVEAYLAENKKIRSVGLREAKVYRAGLPDTFFKVLSGARLIKK